LMIKEFTFLLRFYPVEKILEGLISPCLFKTRPTYGVLP
jgi:hypothetical protein